MREVPVCLRWRAAEAWESIKLLREDVGGTVARTLLFDAESGEACIRSYGRPELIF